MPAVSPGASAEDEVAQRESIDDVLADPAAYVDADITIMENIDQVYVPDSAFVFSGTEVQGQLLVVLSAGATVDKPIAADRVVSATGRVIPFTAERMAAAGLELTPDDERLSGFGGNAVLVVSHIGDPLAR